MFKPVILLFISNIFMTFAWYGHLKDLKTSPLWMAILVSWSIAFFEYCFQVPGNRIGSQYFSLEDRNQFVICNFPADIHAMTLDRFCGPWS
jgi:uncharacterized protein (DUF486 family)